MALDKTRLLKIAGLGVGVLGVMALIVIATPVVWGQTTTANRTTILDQLVSKAGGAVLGVEVRDVEEADVKRERLSGIAGAIVENVHAESAAAKAGIKTGDVIVSFDGERVRGARHLERLVAETPTGRTVDIALVRNGDRMTVKVAIEAERPFEPLKRFSYSMTRPDAFQLAVPKFRNDSFTLLSRFGRGRLGVGVQDLTEQLGDYFGTSNGALVTAVDDGTPAKAAGLKAGDVITKINGETVRDSSDLRQKLSGVSGETKITIMRDKREVTLTAKIEDDRAVTRKKSRIF